MARAGLILILLNTICPLATSLSAKQQRDYVIQVLGDHCNFGKCRFPDRCDYKMLLDPPDADPVGTDTLFEIKIVGYNDGELACNFTDVPDDKAWDELTELSGLTIGGNGPTTMIGRFPPFFLRPPTLITFSVTNTQFTGKLDSLPWQNSAQMLQIDLSKNRLSGQLPSDLFKNKHKLTVFKAPNNAISGTIPNNFDMSNLNQLDLENNRLTGSLPRDIHADFMETFRLSNNQLTGTLDFDGKMGSQSGEHGFAELYLDNNKFTGQLPQSLSKMTSLKKIHLQNNLFSGLMPNLKALADLVEVPDGPKLKQGAEVNFTGNMFACPMPSMSVVYDTANCVCKAGWQTPPGIGAPNPDYNIKYNGWGRSPSNGLALPDGVVNSGRFNCTQCSPGKFSGQTWTDKCSDCDKGTHADQYATSKCEACGEGLYADTKGAVDCQLCKPGRFNNRKKQSTCNGCSSGRYQAKFQQTECLQCGLGQYSKDPESKKCDICAPGYYAEEKGKSQCTPCTPGTFMSDEQAKKCTDCPTGQYSVGFQSLSCTKCPEDRVKLEPGASKCGGCHAGYFLDATTSNCAPCLGGTFNSQKNSYASSCSQCESGKFTNKQQSTACDTCTMLYAGPEFLAPTNRTSCLPWYESWVAFGAEAGLILLVIIIIGVICFVKRCRANSMNGAEHAHKLLTLRDFDSSNAGGSYMTTSSKAQSDVSTDDEDDAKSSNGRWERRSNNGETWYYNKLTHESTLQRPAGFESDEDDDIPDAPTEFTAKSIATGTSRVTAVVLKYKFTAATDDAQQLSADKNEEVTLLQEFDDGWWKVRNSSNEEGLVPASYCHRM